MAKSKKKVEQSTRKERKVWVPSLRKWITMSEYRELTKK